MRALFLYAGAVVVILLAGVASSRQRLTPRSLYMELPADYRTSFVQYATVDRSDNVSRNIYISPESLAAAVAGEELPDGTRIVIEAYSGERGDNGKVTQDVLLPFIHMAEKRKDWHIEDLQTAVRVGDWNFASFEADTGNVTDPSIQAESLSDCFTCHDVSATPRRDFTFTRRLLDDYIDTHKIQYAYCNAPDRIPCRF